MTTFFMEKTTCSNCGTESEYKKISSTSAFGSADLDTRPPETKRSTISAWVQRCPECGYCASNVGKTNPDSRPIVNEMEYKNQLNDPAFPELANSFLCKAIIDREAGNYVSAAWALIHAAWACDDSDRPAQAEFCRQKAADKLVLAREHGQQVSAQEGAGIAILVDLLRRSGRFEQARQVIATQRDGTTEDIIARILDFQSSLIDRNDVSCHTLAGALGDRE